MKKLLFILVLMPFLMMGQTTTENYTKVIVYKDSTATLSASQVTYFDGLGRPVQQNANAQSNTGKDIITHIEYDAFGRQTKEYLPYVTTQNDMEYIGEATAKTDIGNHYQNVYGDSNPYSEKLLENSPIGKVLKQAAPGNAWAMGSGHEIKMEYQTNAASEVKRFKATSSWNGGYQLYDIGITQQGTYAANELYKTITTDEGNKKTEEFKNKKGQVVLKRTFNSGAHDTYYVYDPYGNLAYVLPPLAEGAFDQNTLDGLCYQYRYDARNRLAAKKLPGKQWEYIVYDKLDKPVATGPAFSPWGDGSIGMLITEYDAFGRVVQTGWKAMAMSESNRGTWQSNVNGGSNPFVLGANDILTKNYYDTYAFLNGTVTFPANAAVSVKGQTTGSWTRVLTLPTEQLGETSYTIYDAKYRLIRTGILNYLGGYTQTYSKLDFMGKTEYTLTRHKRDAGSIELVTTDRFTYTAQDRLALHTQQINNLPEQLIASNTYDALGQLISKNVGGEDATGSLGLQKVDYTYNIRGWLKSINDVDNLAQGGNVPNDLFSFKLSYNDPTTGTPLYNGNISQTAWKTGNDNKLRQYNYDYDDLNRMLSATYSKPENFASVNSYGESLSYDKNGNIITLNRMGGYDDDYYVMPIDNLTYSYETNSNKLVKVFDATNHLGGFKDDTAGITDPADDYAYDANGNMTRDDNKGITNITYNHLNLPVKITFATNRNIAYVYNAVGVKLKKIVTNNSSLASTDYLNGFQYLKTGATGAVKLQFFPHAEGYVSNTVVSGNNVYRYIFNYEDHLGNTRLSYTYDSVMRVTTILEENNYYPFGLAHTNYNWDKSYYDAVAAGNAVIIKPVPSPFKYKFQGQERQDELGLNWDSFKWRNYDYAIGRFMNIDPLAPDFPQWSPYVFSGNLVTISKELEGMEPEFLVQKDGKLTSGVITLMHAAYGYSTASLNNSTWIISTDPRVRNWDKLTGHPEASVKGTQVMYSSGVKKSSPNYWLGLIGHEQSHRSEVENEGNAGFYSKYLLQGATRNYQDIDTEATAFKFGSNDNGVDLSDKLLSYKGGAVMDIFQRGNLTNNEKASMLEAVGNQFKRDVVLQGNIDGAKGSLENLKDVKMDGKTKTNMTNLLNGLIKNWTKQQNDITKKYGE